MNVKSVYSKPGDMASYILERHIEVHCAAGSGQRLLRVPHESRIEE
jgi:hypothetical protein